MDAAAVDQIRLNFNETGLTIVNVVIGIMMFGVALDIKLDDFIRIAKSPKAPLIGLVAQFLLLPALTYLLTRGLNLVPSIALGMILVAACPGGNLSNLMTHLAGGNTAVSVSMTAISTVAAIFMTPFNLLFWGKQNPATAAILRDVSLSPIDVLTTVFGILGIPLVLGILTARAKPALVEKVREPFKVVAVVVFILVLLGALIANFKIFLQVIGLVVFAVLLHNALAIGTGYLSGKLARLPERDTRAVSIEVGIQNSALGLVLVFNFFEGLGGMAIIVASWGIWHIVAGLTLAFVWSRRPVGDTPATPAAVNAP